MQSHLASVLAPGQVRLQQGFRRGRFIAADHSPAQTLQRLLAPRGGEFFAYLRWWEIQRDMELAERDDALIFEARCALTCRYYRGRTAKQMRAAKVVATKLHGYVKFRRHDRYLFMPAIDGEPVDYLLTQVASLNRVVAEIGVPRTIVERWIEDGRLPALKGTICGVEMILVSPICARRLARLARPAT